MAKRPASKKPTAAKAKTTRKKAAGRPKPSTASARLKTRATPGGLTDRDHLIGVIQDGTGSSKLAAKRTLDAILGTVTLSLKKNARFQIAGFGTFSVGKRKARMGRNPRTGEAIKIKASKSVRFKAGTKLKAGV